MGASEDRHVDPVPVSRRDSPIDLSQLYQLGDATTGDPARNFVHDIIELFLQLAPEIYETARLALKDGDGHSLARAAHKLKSQAAYFGAQRMVLACRQLEQHGYDNEIARCELLMHDLEDELDRVVAALQPHRYASG